MPRNSAGVYSLPAGNPVAVNTIISPTWANPTMSDLANEITNSLDRNGRGGMLVPFQFLDGTVASPGLTFTSEPGSGIYRAGTNDVRVAIGGDDTVRFVDDSGSPPGSQQPFEVWNGMNWVKVATGGPANITLTGAVTGTGTSSIATVISADAVGTAEIEDNAVTFAKMANSSVGTNELINSSVTLAKMQNIPTANLLGRASGGTGVVEDLTAAQVRTLLNVANGAEANPALVSQAEAQAGTATAERMWSAQRVAQAIAAQASSGGGIKSIQRGTINLNGASGTFYATITAVNLNKSFVVATCSTGIYDVAGVNRTLNARVKLLNSTTVQATIFAGAVFLAAQVDYEVVEFL